MTAIRKADDQNQGFTLMSIEEFDHLMETRGWVVFENAVKPDLIERMAADIEIAYDICRALQVKNGISVVTEFTVHHLISIPEVRETYLEYLDTNPIKPYIERYFSGNYVLNSYGGAINSAFSRSYAHNIHRDIRSYSGDLPLLLNTLVMLDDFTADNGATFMMPGSHKFAPKPTEEEFYAVAQRALGPKGSILMFNSNVWHAGGDNGTANQRRSVTPMYNKPYVKAGFDYPRALGYDKGDSFSPYLKQVIGYNSRIPATLEEWYQPQDKRMYKPDQG
jgi:ectoine hydroxylase-related dioxygenase (phytanoyl-CoA dioxygenase family)